MRRLGIGEWGAIFAALLFFFGPLVITAIFSMWQGGGRYDFSAYRNLLNAHQMWASLGLSVDLAIETVLAVFVIIVPAMLVAHLRFPWLRPMLDVLAALPFVIPAIALVAGLTTLYTGPDWLIGTPHYLVIPYVLVAMPYAYRSLDVGLGALDLHTLTDAGLSLGASWPQMLRLVVLPNLRTALLGATLLTVTIVIGEFTFANLLLFKTFAVYITEVGQSTVTEASALTLLSFAITWAAMLGVLASGRGRTPAGAVR